MLFFCYTRFDFATWAPAILFVAVFFSRFKRGREDDIKVPDLRGYSSSSPLAALGNFFPTGGTHEKYEKTTR